MRARRERLEIGEQDRFRSRLDQSSQWTTRFRNTGADDRLGISEEKFGRFTPTVRSAAFADR